MILSKPEFIHLGRPQAIDLHVLDSSTDRNRESYSVLLLKYRVRLAQILCIYVYDNCFLIQTTVASVRRCVGVVSIPCAYLLIRLHTHTHTKPMRKIISSSSIPKCEHSMLELQESALFRLRTASSIESTSRLSFGTCRSISCSILLGHLWPSLHEQFSCSMWPMRIGNTKSARWTTPSMQANSCSIADCGCVLTPLLVQSERSIRTQSFLRWRNENLKIAVWRMKKTLTDVLSISPYCLRAVVTRLITRIQFIVSVMSCWLQKIFRLTFLFPKHEHCVTTARLVRKDWSQVSHCWETHPNLSALFSHWLVLSGRLSVQVPVLLSCILIQLKSTMIFFINHRSTFTP